MPDQQDSPRGRGQYLSRLSKSVEPRSRVVSFSDRDEASRSMSNFRERASTAWTSLDGRGRPQSPLAYYVILSTVLALTAIGLMMVLSSSAVEQISNDLDPLSLFRRQAIWAAIGVVGMFAFSFFPVQWLQRAAWPSYVLAVVLLLLVAFSPLGHEVGGNKNWLRFSDGFQMQPSEPAKIAIALWSGLLLKRKQRYLSQWKETTFPVMLLGTFLLGLVLLGRDLGTTMILAAVLLTSLWAAGVSAKVFALMLGAGGLGAVLFAILNSNRSIRLAAWLFGECDGGVCDQADAGITALARGGLTGVGLGGSQVKWSWIPEAHNDFVFAIIGEELGLIGTLLIIALFAVFALVSLRVVLRYDDVFIRVVGSCIIVWIAAQAAVNMAMVVGMLPVIGIPLPFISYGGSALTFTLIGVGILLSFARPQGNGRMGFRSRNSAPSRTKAQAR